MQLADKEYIVIVQCHIVKERCAGYFCEKAFHERSDGFADYAKDKAYRMIFMTCGGCCGRGLQRKLANLVAKLRQQEDITPEKIVVQFSSCISKESHHGPICPHLVYLKTLVKNLGLDWREDTHISKKAESRRREGQYVGEAE